MAPGSSGVSEQVFGLFLLLPRGPPLPQGWPLPHNLNVEMASALRSSILFSKWRNQIPDKIGPWMPCTAGPWCGIQASLPYTLRVHP